jgi:hypothetical protein
VGLAGAVTLVAAALGAAPGVARAGWTVQPIGAPGLPNGSLSKVSCASSTDCTAVGYSDNSAGVAMTLAEHWNGTIWQLQSTPNPAGALSSKLTGVSCASTTDCTAVGYYVNSAGVAMTLAESWNGTSWQLQSTPNPAGALSSKLVGVSCTSSTDCTAVYSYDNSAGVGVTLAESWNGSNWQLQSTPNAAGATYSNLMEVSCTSSTDCTAAGYHDNSAGVGVTSAEHWNGTSWQLQGTPNPGALHSSLAGVSCTSSTDCTAVGFYRNRARPRVPVTLAVRWNGTSWQPQSTPNPAGALQSNLRAASCASSTDCIAVGYYENGAGTIVTLAELWNGINWQLQSTPNPAGARYSSLRGVSCASSTDCTAVGYYENSARTVLTLAERWNGTSWQLLSTPNPAG